MAENKNNNTAGEGQEEEKFVTVTLGDGNTVEIPKKEIVFQSVDFSEELQGVIATQPYQAPSDGSQNPGSGSRRTSPPMPDVDVSSDVQSAREEDTTITSTSLVSESAGHDIASERERDLKFGASAAQKWKEKKDLHKAELIEKGGLLGKMWLAKTAEGRAETREIVEKGSKAGHVWKGKYMETKEEEERKKKVGMKLLEKVRRRREAAAQLKSAAEGEKDEEPKSAAPSAQDSTTDQLPAPAAKTSPQSPKAGAGKAAAASGSDKSDEETPAGKTKLKTAMTKVQPKVSILKRKGAPPILSLPGEAKISGPKSTSPAKSPTAKKKSTDPPASENKRLLKTPIVSASPSPEPDPDPGPDSATEAGKEEKKKDGADCVPKETPKTFRPGGPQEMAGRIILSCKRGDWMTVENLLKMVPTEGLDTHLVTEGVSWTPVHFAAKDNRVTIVDQLISYGYNVNAKGNDGTTALHLACLHAREDTIRMLLLRNADPLIPAGPKAQTPLHLICSKSSTLAVIPLQLLLKSSPIKIRTFVDSDGSIPLFCAIDSLNHSIVRELLTDYVKEQVSYANADGENCVHIAIKKKDLEMLKILYEHGANFDHQNKEGDTILHYTCQHGMDQFVRFLHTIHVDPNIKNKDEETPIHLATQEGHHKIVDMLVEKFKASVHERTKDGSTLMHLASKAGHSQISAIFIKKGVPLYMPNKRGAKAIHLAAMTGNKEIVRSVLQKGEKVDCKTLDGFTALHLAVQANKSDIVEILLGHGAEVAHKAGKLKETPLHACAKVRNGEYCADQLIKSGAPINEANEDGETAFHAAARHGNLHTAIMLLMEGADFAVLNKNGENVMHIITRACHFEIAQRVLQHVMQANSKEAALKLVNQRNKNGESSVHYAALLTSKKTHYQFEDRDLVRLLLQTGGDPSLEAAETKETAIHYCAKSGNINVLDEIISQMGSTDAQTACNKQAKNGWSPLLYACYHGHPEVIQKLLSQNARVDVFDEAGRASLHLAAELGHENVVKLLLENNAFVNVRNKSGLTPLHLAAGKGYNNMVQSLIKDGAIIDAMSLIKQTPLHLAAESGQLQVCQTLLQLKADVNALDNMAQTPLHLAAQNDHPEVLKLFLQHKPELVSVPNKHGQTCAHIAAEKGSVAVLKELMKFNVETVKTARIKKTGNTALHLACEGGHVKVVRLLLQSGAKPNDENSEGYTALHAAARNGHLRVLAALKGSGDWKICSRKNGLTALHIAAKYGQTDFVSEMLTVVPAGIKSERCLKDPNGDYGVTPLHLAAQNGHESTVRLLMNSKGVMIDEPTAVYASTPMHYAAQGGHLLVAGLIISRSSDSLKITDKNGKTCVHVAAAAGHREMVALLLGQGAEINSQDKKLWTPLHYAARYGYLDVVELLVESGADPMAASKDEKIPLCCAAGAGHYDVISFLLKKDHETLALMDDRSFLLDLMSCGKNHENKPIREFILVSEAPIDTAVKLAKCYENLSLKDKERFKDLEAACAYCDEVAIDLLTVTATISNPAALLKGIDHKNTEFLDVLIELERKDVVSQHAVQRYLTEVWMGRLKWPGSWFVMLFFSFLFCPIVWIAVSIPIGHNLGKKPIIKFTSYLTSHIFFIVWLVYTTLNVQLPLFEYESLAPYWFEWLLYIWILGILVSEITNPSDRGGLGGIKVGILFICFVGVAVHVCAIFAHLIYYDVPFAQNPQMFHALYIRNQLFAFALLLSFVEFLNFLTFHPLFGPWGVIIQDLIKDLLLFMAIMAIFLTGFTLQVCAIYQPVYRPPSTNNGTIPEVGSVFQSPGITFEMLFFSLFGLVEPDGMPPMHLNPAFSKYIMKFVFGTFLMVTVIVLINLLIAMMSNTYQRIEDQSDIEWKFGRAKLIRNMNRTLPTPSPINLFAGIPLLLAEKVQQKYMEMQSEKEMALAKQAFGHLDQQRSSLTSAKKWLNRRASRASRASRATSGVTSGFGADDAGTDELKPISEVVNWPLIVQKYLESIGAISAKTDDDEGEGGGGGGAGTGDAATTDGEAEGDA